MDERLARWYAAQRQAAAIVKRIEQEYSFARHLRNDFASANTLVEPATAASAAVTGVTAITYLTGSASPLYSPGLPATGAGGFWRPGKVVELTLGAIGTTGTTPGNTVFQWNVATSQGVTTGTSLGSATIALAASITNANWLFHGFVECRTIGTAGTLYALGYLFLGTLSTAASPPYLVPTATATSAAIDTTVNSAINFLVTPGATTVSFTTQVALWKALN